MTSLWPKSSTSLGSLSRPLISSVVQTQSSTVILEIKLMIFAPTSLLVQPIRLQSAKRVKKYATSLKASLNALNTCLMRAKLASNSKISQVQSCACSKLMKKPRLKAAI